MRERIKRTAAIVLALILIISVVPAGIVADSHFALGSGTTVLEDFEGPVEISNDEWRSDRGDDLVWQNQTSDLSRLGDNPSGDATGVFGAGGGLAEWANYSAVPDEQPETLNFWFYWDKDSPAFDGSKAFSTTEEVEIYMYDGSGNTMVYHEEINRGAGNSWKQLRFNFSWQDGYYNLTTTDKDGNVQSESSSSIPTDGSIEELEWKWNLACGTGDTCGSDIAAFYIDYINSGFIEQGLDGYVVDPAGDPVADAQINVSGNSVTSGSDGSYRVGATSGPQTVTVASSIDETTEKVDVPAAGIRQKNFTVADADIGGKVVSCPATDSDCSNPDPVADATVQVLTWNTTAVEEKFSDVNSQAEAEEKIEALEDELGSFDIDNFDAGLDPASKFGDGGDAVYPAIHTTTDWGLSGIGGNPTVLNRNSDIIDLGEPAVSVSSDDRLAISLWDPTDGGGLVPSPGDEELPGVTTSGRIKFTEVGPSGEVISTKSVETTPQVDVTGATFALGSKTHEFAETSLSPGYYKVSVQDPDSDVSYYIKVGNPTTEEVVPGYAETVNDEIDGYEEEIQQAKTLKNLKNNESVLERRVTTDENGRWEMAFDAANTSDITRVGVAAAKVPSTNSDYELNPALDDPGTKWRSEDGDFSQDLLSEIDDARDAGYEGSVYLPSETRMLEPGQTATLELRELSLEPLNDQNISEQRAEQLANLFDTSTNALRELWSEPAANMTDDEVDEAEDRYNETKDQAKDYADETGQSCADLIDDLEPGQTVACSGDGGDGGDPGSDFDTPPPGELTDEEVLDRLRELEQMIAENSETPDEPADVGIVNNTLSGTFTMPGDVDPDDVSVLVEYANGTISTVNESHYTVEETINPLDGERIIVEDISVSETAPNPTLRVDAVVDESGPIPGGENSTTIVTSRGDAINPAYPNDVPQLQAVDANTLTPGSNQRVVLEARPATGTGFKRLANATVYGPDGTELDSEVRDTDEVRFTTNGSGTHVARMEYRNIAGDVFVERIPIEAAKNVGATPPTIRLRGKTRPPIAGDGLRNAAFDVTDGASTASVRAVLSGQAEISELHVRGMDEIPHNDIDISLVKENGETVRKHVSVVLYRSVSDESLLYRNENAFAQSGETGLGSYDDEDGVIRTFTDDTGTVLVEIVENPDRIQRFLHWVDRQTATLPNPLSALPVIGIGLVTARRRWWA